MMNLELDLRPPPEAPATPGFPSLMQRIASHSARPRYTFMVLDLIARVGDGRGVAGPYVREGQRLVPIREWLAAAIMPSAERHHRRQTLREAVRREIIEQGRLPADVAEAERLVEAEIANRICASGKTAVSRAVSELVRAGMVKRHYQGYRVDHVNRGAQRLAVYTVPPEILRVLERFEGGWTS